MNILLDTHTFMWWDSRSTKLSAEARSVIENEHNVVYLSVVSVWEIQLKRQLGKLSIDGNLEEIVNRHLRENDFQLLPVHLPHVLELDKLPLHHKDPFDRLLIAQSLVESLDLVSKDSQFSLYPLNVIW